MLPGAQSFPPWLVTAVHLAPHMPAAEGPGHTGMGVVEKIHVCVCELHSAMALCVGQQWALNRAARKKQSVRADVSSVQESDPRFPF